MWTQSATDGEDWNFGKDWLMKPLDDKLLELEVGEWRLVLDVLGCGGDKVACADKRRGGV